MKYILLIPTFCLLWVNAQLLDEGFEGGVMPPTGWTVEQTNPDETWQINTTAVPDGSFAGEVNYDLAANPQDESLISPSMDFSNFNAPSLSFISSASYYYSVAPEDKYDISVLVSIDDGANWTKIWDEEDLAIAEGGTFRDWDNYLIREDLSAFAGNSNVKLKFNYWYRRGSMGH